jgi:hypothetical protein
MATWFETHGVAALLNHEELTPHPEEPRAAWLLEG